MAIIGAATKSLILVRSGPAAAIGTLHAMKDSETEAGLAESIRPLPGSGNAADEGNRRRDVDGIRKSGAFFCASIMADERQGRRPRQAADRKRDRWR
jgi:hypothetical protein